MDFIMLMNCIHALKGRIMMLLELRHLKLIEAIAEEGSVTKAGSRLYLTQSALSHQLRDAEEKLGTPLFARINKRMLLTPAGERLLLTAQKVLGEIRRAEEDVRQIALNREGVLRVSTECYTCYHWLPSILSAFNSRFPRIEVQIVVDATDDPQQAILEGKVDVVLSMSPMKNNKLTSRPLFRDELVVIMSKNHRLSSKSYIKAEDFRDEHLLTYSGPEDHYAIDHVLIPAGVSPARVSSMRLTEAIVEMAKAGAGIAVMARWAMQPQIDAGVITALPLTRGGLFRRWSAITLKNRAAPPYLDAFINLLADNSVLVSKKPGKSRRKPGELRLVNSLECAAC
jgi:LysR family transcriptional regulator for metE and metH